MADLLLEIACEEIPARLQQPAAAELARLVGEALGEAGLAPGLCAGHATARRLALQVEGLPARQADRVEEKRGPRVDAPDKAIQGFLGANRTSLDKLEKRDSGKGVFYFLVEQRPGRATAEVLSELLPKALAELSWPKSMRWGDRPQRWIRPIRSLTCLFDGKTLPIVFGHLTAGSEVRGHRFMAPKPFPVTRFKDYAAGLRANSVALDLGLRKEIIQRDAKLAAAKEGLEPVADEALLDEVAGLVEWPVILTGRIDDRFMALPPEVLTAVMRKHQKYFALKRPDGALAARFVVVSDLHARDGGKAIVAGNERVLRARLEDATFFWDLDRKATPEAWLPKLAEITVHAALGSYADKAQRLGALAAWLCQHVPDAQPGPASRAALLAKTDLVSGVVGEFPELQGIMGRYYARHGGEDAAVAEAIGRHYAPQGPHDECPRAPLTVTAALADKLDSLAGFFLAGERPTGSKDPFALRRAALGTIRLILENHLRLPLRRVLAEAAKPFAKPAAETTRAVDELVAFFADRLKVQMRDQGLRHDLIDAAFAQSGDDDLVRLIERTRALKDFLAGEDGANLLVAYRRAGNILRIEEKKDGRRYDQPVSKELLRYVEERALVEALPAIEGLVREALEKEKFAAAMQALAALRPRVDSFFDRVKVNADDASVRSNRLNILAGIRSACARVADFARIEGGEGETPAGQG
ncbi:MAG: glycine--tRNA ligase subunit beta [Alphaproteobacteria bacterium]|nr:glycine--tRNA ligase subunit beta [Alphaproteobacteria bacterium]